ncbi:hypothetical protein [Glutamicibacter nicotianae]|uniref:hypothetical protein n=1 Tax=Glutamicibacter nicotianae TaxID=37929 RepID=UPI0025533159|nr:hypothetical protein [Glutamicibacter nicotianae]WIV45355.1 hypothetical protein QQS42_07130 [Glutamicibacter nicotianae]
MILLELLSKTSFGHSQYPFSKKTRAFSAFPTTGSSFRNILLIFGVDEIEIHPIRCGHITRPDFGGPVKLGEGQLVVGISWLKFRHSFGK